MPIKWKKPPSNLSLSSDFIDIWQTRLDLSVRDIEYYADMLCAEEKQRVDKFKFSKKRHEYIITRGLLRRVLAQTLDTDPHSLQFEYAEHGKPYLTERWQDKTVSFNVTHSGNKALVAVTLERNIGVDIELIRTEVEFDKLSNRFFSADESSSLETYKKQDLSKAFYACWTGKEAYVKALGDGISFGLSEFSVSVDPEEEQVTLVTHWDTDEASRWTIINLDTGKDYIGAIAADKKEIKLRYWEYGAQE